MNDDSSRTPGERRAWHTDEQWSRLHQRIEASEPLPDRPRDRVRWIGAAAAAVVIVGAGAIWQLTHRTPPEIRAVTTAAGERIVLHLADRSQITVGPSTTVRYRASGQRREVEVDGMAAFDVVHDATRPFVVHAKNALATDLGTRFVVRAYAADSSVEVAVASGSVALSDGARSMTLALRAGDVGRVSARGTASAAPRARAASDTAWIDGRLAFDDVPLSDVAAELERWFDVEVRIADPSLARRRVSAVYNTPTLAGVLEALSATLGARAERAGRVVTLTPRTR